MALVSVEEITPPAAWGTITSLGATRRFRVTRNDPEDGAYAALTSAGIPARGSAHPDNGDMLAGPARVEVDPTPGNRLIFIVSVDYETPTQETPLLNPLDDRAQIYWGEYTQTRVMSEDIDGDPIENSAKDQFDPPPTRQWPHSQVTIIQNVSVAAWNVNTATTYKFSVNDAAIIFAGASIEAHEGLMTSFTGRLALRNDTQYYIRTCVIALRNDDAPWYDWRLRMRDVGFRYLDAGTPKKIKLTPETGEPDTVYPTEAVDLDGAGAKLGDGLDAVFRMWHIHEAKDWGVLGLPENKDGT